MKTTGVNLKVLRLSGLSVSACVDVVFASTDFESLIKHAKRGDKGAAKQILALASYYLTFDGFGQMPPGLRRYLGNALAAASIKGSADVALNLMSGGRPKSGGRPPLERRTMLRIGHLIYKATRAGKAGETNDDETCALRMRIDAGRPEGDKRAGATIEEACDALEAHIKAGIKISRTFFGYTKAPTSKRLGAIYNTVLPEIESTYDYVLST
jgi:hypothetical protein